MKTLCTGQKTIERYNDKNDKKFAAKTANAAKPRNLLIVKSLYHSIATFTVSPSIFCPVQRLALVLCLIFHNSLIGFQGEFSKGVLRELPPTSSRDHFEEVIEKKAVFCDSIWCSMGWGHAVQDTVIPIYKYLKEHDLLKTPLCICIQTFKDCGPVSVPAREFMTALFPCAELKYVTQTSPPCLFLDVEVIHSGIPGCGPDGVLIGKYMELMRSFGFKKNVTAKLSTPEPNIVHDFVDYALDCYHLDHIEMVPNRVCVVNKKPACPRIILNAKKLTAALKKQGCEVLNVDFDGMSVRDQIMTVRSCQFFISTHGAALTNTMFLHKDANVVLIWPEDAKYFHNRFYCPFTSILLSKGIRLIEYDKPYSTKDVYTMNDIQIPEYFFKEGKALRLKPQKKNWKDILAFPVPCMYDIYNVNMFIENPAELIALIRRSVKSKVSCEQH